MGSISVERINTMDELTQPTPKPGVCIPWEEKKKELPPIQGDEAQFRQLWEEVDGMAYTYIWHLLVSF
jgi:hypothetical protein